MHFKIFNVVVAFLAVAFFSVSAEAQVFYSTGGGKLENAQSVGEPVARGAGLGKVRVKQAPVPPNRISQVRNDLKAAKIPDYVANNSRFLGGAGFAIPISDAWPVKQTAIKLKQRPSRAPSVSGAIKIRNASELRNNRSKLQDNTRRTFIFTRKIYVPYPILVGSNKTIWIDGTLIYNGVDVVPEGGAAFTPRPLKNDGVFSVRHQATFRRTYKPSREADRNFNDELMRTEVKANRKLNTTFRGTKRGKIVVNRGSVVDDKQKLPKTNGIVVIAGNNITIDGLRIQGALNAIYASSSVNVNVRNCFLDRTVYRGVHIIGSRIGAVRNNLVYNSLFDGIDLDGFSNNFSVIENVVIGARDRFLIWTEIDANNNLINNNVGIVLSGNAPNGGGFQENGTELNRGGVFAGTRYNRWLNNNIFYASSKQFDGIVMRRYRDIQFDTITFQNNYVWALNGTVHKHNPKRGVENDVYYLIKKR